MEGRPAARLPGNPALKELSGETGRAEAERFCIARPLRMPSTDCLQCHSTPEAAPASMVARYGNNGFGWKMGDVIGMQRVEVPVTGPNSQALKGLLVTLGSLTCVLEPPRSRAISRCSSPRSPPPAWSRC